MEEKDASRDEAQTEEAGPNERVDERKREMMRSHDQADGDAPGAAQPRALGFWSLSLYNR